MSSYHEVLLIKIVCKHCQTLFYMCRSCFRGHVYCSDQCRNEVSTKISRRAQSKYRTSKKGRKKHRLYEQNRRRTGIFKKIKKNVADGTTGQGLFRVIYFPVLPKSIIRCSFCGSIGRVVKNFPLRFSKNLIRNLNFT